MNESIWKLTWIVENFTDSSDYNDLIQAVRDSGRKCFEISKKNHFDFETEKYINEKLILFQGSIQMTKLAQEKLVSSWPVAFCSWDKYLCSSYYPHFKEYIFNDKYKLLSLKELKDNKFDIYREFGREALIFCRPDSGAKIFQAQLLDLQDFDRFWLNGLAGGGMKDEELVLVSTPKKINSHHTPE